MKWTATRRKWALLLLLWLVQSAILYGGWAMLWLDYPPPLVDWSRITSVSLGDARPRESLLAQWWEGITDFHYARMTLAAIGALTVLQVLFLLPVRKPGPARPVGVPMWLSMGAAGAAGALLLLGLVLGLHDLIWVTSAWKGSDALPLRPEYFSGAVFLASWAALTPLMVAFVRRGGRETMLGRLASLLLLGTVVEAVAIIPVDVMVRRKSDCYCGEGTFWALTICLGVGAVVAGPAALLPILARRRKRWYAGHCEVCGYEMTGTPNADRCPECGAGWRA